MELRIRCLKGSVSGHSRRTCSGECIFLNRPGRTLASLPTCRGWTGRTLASLPLLGVSWRRNSSIRRLKPGEGSAYRSAPPEVGVMLLRVGRGAVPLSNSSDTCSRGGVSPTLRHRSYFWPAPLRGIYIDNFPTFPRRYVHQLMAFLASNPS